MRNFRNKEIQKNLRTKHGSFTIASFEKAQKLKLGSIEKLPFSIKILLESALRNFDDYQIRFEDIKNLINWKPELNEKKEIAFKPGRVILQDFTGVPCVVDLAALRNGMKSLKGDIKKINPQVHCDLVIDHSVQVDAYGTKDAINKNISLEFKRNKERYRFLKWGQNAFKNFSVVPPATGIIHQINLEYLSKGIIKKRLGKVNWAYPDSLVGTDSHTTMINGLGVLGWGVGGIEAEAVMLGEPIYMLTPKVIGFELTGSLEEGVSATDLVLTIVEILRKKGVVDNFIEFYGDGIKNLSLPDRATISNMCPEYGATIGIFPVDEKTLDYYRLTGRPKNEIDLFERYMKDQGLFYNKYYKNIKFSENLKLDISSIKPSIAGPKRPQERILLASIKNEFKKIMSGYTSITGDDCPEERVNGRTLKNGSVVLASITSCTNTSNPSVLVSAGLLAKNAVEKGLDIKKFVKTSFIPGSQVVEEYLSTSGLLPYLEKLKFNIVGYGCGPCIGNSGPLDKNIIEEINDNNLIVASVLSGNRNFEGRISPHTKINFLTSPALVVAYAITGTINFDFEKECMGYDNDGNEVFLKDIWPRQDQINQIINKFVSSKSFQKRYKNIYEGNKYWKNIKASKSDLYKWNKNSTYIQEPPFFKDIVSQKSKIKHIENARVILKLGDSVTTDHISPAGNIPLNSPAGQYLIANNVKQDDFNSYGSRRGNDKVMVRGTFANIRLKNHLAEGKEGSWTKYHPNGKLMTVFDASQLYQKDNTSLIVIAGKEYGTGSSRDWAAKGTSLLGIKIVIAESFERIHRSNLAGMGVLPLQFKSGESAEKLGIEGDEIFTFDGIDDNLIPKKEIDVKAKSPDGKVINFKTIVRLDTPVEIDYYRNGGILQTVLRKLAKKNRRR